MFDRLQDFRRTVDMLDRLFRESGDAGRNQDWPGRAAAAQTEPEAGS